jgi:hypothetical protein
MTSQVKKTIDATDICAVEVECTGCGFRATWPLAAWDGAFASCSNCKRQWPVGQHRAHEALTNLIRSLRELASVNHESEIPFCIRFELVESKEKP